MTDALHRELPRIEAQRLWQMAKAAAYPHMDQNGQDALLGEVHNAMKPAHERDPVQLTPSGKPMLMLNGVPIGMRALRGQLALSLGRGYSE